MGAGLRRATAAAIATNLTDEDRNFLRAIVQYSGAATPRECPSASRPQDRARQKCKRLGLVTYEGGYWRITDLGRAILTANNVFTGIKH